MYKSSGSQFVRSTTGLESGPNTLDKSMSSMNSAIYDLKL